MLTAEIFSAKYACDIGLVHHVGNSQQTNQYIEEKIKLILSNAPEGTRITKGLIQKIKTSTWKQARAFTVKTIAQKRVSKEGQEGLAAFFDKRPPSWKRGQ